MAYFESESFSHRINEQGNAKIKAALRDKIRPIYGKAKDDFLNEFINHDVTTEIMDGAYAENKTNSLGGYGNLFSFLGFDAERNPIDELLPLLEEAFRGPTFRREGGKRNPRYIITIRVPSIQFLEESDELRVSGGYTGRSWVSLIEKGLNNAPFYLYDDEKEEGFANSKSGPAYQVKKKPLRKGHKFQPQSYITNMLEQMNETLRRMEN